MIPKIIHYCWFGGKPLPESAKKCIASWRKFLPDYEIKEWNESNFDVNSIKYTREAYRLKKYAFVSDYARMWILYNYGGLYFDIDVELLKPIDDIIARGNFMGQEAQNITPGLCLYKKVVEWYQEHHFAMWDGKFTGTIVNVVSDILSQEPIKKLNGGILYASCIYIYPPEYFCPKNYFTGYMNITDNTRSIHHYSASWVDHRSILQKMKKRIKFIRAHYNI